MEAVRRGKHIALRGYSEVVDAALDVVFRGGIGGFRTSSGIGGTPDLTCQFIGELSDIDAILGTSANAHYGRTIAFTGSAAKGLARHARVRAVTSLQGSVGGITSNTCMVGAAIE
jgi:hypothetical protein